MILEVRILNELRAHFAEVRILKNLGSLQSTVANRRSE